MSNRLDYEEREAKLPVWAREKMSDLRRDLVRAETDRDALADGKLGPEDTDTVLDPYGLGVSLPKRSTLAYTIGYGGEDVIHVRTKGDGALEIMGMTGIQVEPRSSNLVEIRVRD